MYYTIKYLNADGTTASTVDLLGVGNHKQIYQTSDVLQTQNGNTYVLICCDAGSQYYTEIPKFNLQGQYMDYIDMSPAEFPFALC